MNINLINGDDEFMFEDVGYMEGFEYPIAKPVIEDIAGPQSAVYITSKFGRRPLSWQGLISNDVFENRRLLLQACRQQGTIKTIEFSTCDGLAIQADVEVSKIVMPYKNGRSAVLIEAITPDWRFYSQEEYTSESASTNQTIDNAGNESTNPVFIINGPFTSVTITNLNNSRSFVITLDEYSGLSNGEYITVDCKNRTVKLDDGISIFSAFSGEFLDLEPGENTIQFSPVGGDGNTTLETVYRDAFSGI